MANLYLWWAAFDDYRHLKHNRHEVAIEFGLALLALAVLAWLLSLKLVLSDASIRYRSLLTVQELRLSEIQQIYFNKGRRSTLYVVPLWAHCRYVLVTRRGERMVFGSRFRSGCFAGEKVVLATAQQLYRNAVERFNRGHEVAFGPIRVSQKGVTVEGWKAGLYPWAELEGIDETAGGLFLQLSGGRSVGGRGMAHIPNIHLLAQILLLGIERRKKGEPMTSLPLPGASG